MSEHLIAGAAGGLLAAIVMSFFMMALMRGRPGAPQFLVSKISKKRPEAHKVSGMFLHLIYGTAMGLVFTVLFLDAFDRGLAEMSSALQWGALWGVILWMVSLIWVQVLGMMKAMEETPGVIKLGIMVGMLGVHVIYGLMLGATVGFML
ncbi:MAG: hypothetical protein R3185_04175 [Candidatus Thermoplasmatota archaeon]|nr:hypothetical protein [Candidatus Thermoplasmatota archaeon]